MTFATLAVLWCRGELARRYPDHVRNKKTVVEDVRRFQWLSSVRFSDGMPFGVRRVADIILDDCEFVMGCLSSMIAASSMRRHYVQVIRRALAFAVYLFCVRESLPIPMGWLSNVCSDRAKAWIYFSEDVMLMKCDEVSFARWLFFGLLVREGMRVSEAFGFVWSDVDLVVGVVCFDFNKMDDLCMWVFGVDVVVVLNAWRKLHKVEMRIFLFVEFGDRGDFV